MEIGFSALDAGIPELFFGINQMLNCREVMNPATVEVEECNGE